MNWEPAYVDYIVFDNLGNNYTTLNLRRQAVYIKRFKPFISDEGFSASF